MLFDRVVLSCDLDSMFEEFLPYVSEAWKKLWNVKVSVAVVGEEISKEKMDWYLNYVDSIKLYKPSKNKKINKQVLAKMARHLYVMDFNKDVCLINDLDLLPLSKWYYEDKLSDRKKGQMVCIGQNVFKGSIYKDQFPMGGTTAEGYVFKNILNPYNKKDLKSMFDLWYTFAENDVEKENIITNDFFSDETLYGMLVKHYKKENPEMFLFKEGVLYPSSNIIDRSNWIFNEEKLKKGEYIEAHLLRPISKYEKELSPLFNYIKNMEV